MTDERSDLVRAWAETVTIPTYAVGAPEKNPLFLEKRVYQGSSGVVYPYPVIESVADVKEDCAYTALFLENRYLKIMVLPELGGRVQMALDKTNGYHFVYYNRVIKPALVGLTGPWISGGIEFNWPQHHRPTTFMAMDWSIDANADGSQTIWCAEIEPMFNTKGMHGFTLYPQVAYLKIDVQLSNRSSEPQTFLWWANPAVHVNDDYQSIFPPDVHAVMDHGKRDVSTFPIATGTYYKVNYAPGTDISRYKNIPVPTSYMAYHSDFDFIGCYDHGQRAGMIHVANHHTVPGKKQWTWGTSDFGQAWERQLTDADGPYIELMCGAYTDNQPDFSWLMPGEEKRFTQIFMPFKEIGGIQNANAEAAVNFSVQGQAVDVRVYVTQPRQVRVQVCLGRQVLWERVADLSPEKTLAEQVTLGAAAAIDTPLTVRVLDGERELISCTPPRGEPSRGGSPRGDRRDIPAAARPARAPQEIESVDELYINGLHLEQYRHATYAPEPYYQEALRRDPLDSRCNNALGLLLYRRGKFAEAETYFRRALERLTTRNPNPANGEAYYNLGLCLRMQSRFDAAFDAFYKAIWNADLQAAGYFELARLASRAQRFDEALDLALAALHRNWLHHPARHLRMALLRRLGRNDEALALSAEALTLDRFEYGALWERSLLQADSPTHHQRADVHTYIDLALHYAHAGLFAEAIDLLDRAPQIAMTYYYRGWCLSQAGHGDDAQQAFLKAATVAPALYFPNRLEDVLVLEAAMSANPTDAHAPYLLGNFWYAHRRYAEAIACWERARLLDPTFATVHRNLGLAYFNKRQDAEQAQQAYETAFSLDPRDGRVLFELDQLYKRRNRQPQERLAYLNQHSALVDLRDDLTIERITLLNLLGNPDEAYTRLMARTFHPWEGGEGKVTSQYVWSLVLRARAAIDAAVDAADYNAALTDLAQAQIYPPNLGEGKLYGAQENHIFYYLGCAYAGLGDEDTARTCWQRAAVGLSEPSSVMYYNDQPPDMIFYQGLARRRLGEDAIARDIFQRLVDYGRAHRDDEVQMDYFAVSLPSFLVFDEDLNERNRIHCDYMTALGHLGLGDHTAAAAAFAQVTAGDANHLGAAIHRRLLTAYTA